MHMHAMLYLHVLYMYVDNYLDAVHGVGSYLLGGA